VAVTDSKGEVWSNINTIQCINDAFSRIKVETEIIIDVDTKEVLDGLDTHVDTVKSSVGEFITDAGDIVELYIIITWDAGEEDFIRPRVDGNDHIDVAT